MCGSIFWFTIPPPGFPRVKMEKNSDVLWVGQYLTGDGLTLGKNFCRDVTTVGIVLGSDGLTLARGGDGAPKN